MRDEFPKTELDQKIENADAVVHPRSAMIHTDMPMTEIYQIIQELFGVKPINHPENKEFMEEASTHWQQNNDDELKDPALMIDYAMGQKNE